MSVKRRILGAILSVAGIAIVLFAIPLALLVAQLVADDALLQVERQAVLATRNVPSDFATSDDPVELPVDLDGIGLALYDDTGRLRAGPFDWIGRPNERVATEDEGSWAATADPPGRAIVQRATSG